MTYKSSHGLKPDELKQNYLHITYYNYLHATALK